MKVVRVAGVAGVAHLVRSESPATTTTVTTTVTARGEATAAKATTAAPEAAPTAATAARHARQVGPLWGDLDVATLEHALVEDERLGNKAGFCKLDIGISVEEVISRHVAWLEMGIQLTPWADR